MVDAETDDWKLERLNKVRTVEVRTRFVSLFPLNIRQKKGHCESARFKVLDTCESTKCGGTGNPLYYGRDCHGA